MMRSKVFPDLSVDVCTVPEMGPTENDIDTTFDLSASAGMLRNNEAVLS